MQNSRFFGVESECQAYPLVFVNQGEFDGGFGFAEIDRFGAVLGGEAAKACLD
jgi:hypothetical protein